MRRVASEKSGFTLAELLVVVAVIAVLVAIAIPLFAAQLAAANAATDESNIRAGYGVAQSDAMLEDVAVGDVFVLLNNGMVSRQNAEGGSSSDVYQTKGESKNASGASDSGRVDISGQEVEWSVGQTITYTVIEGKRVIIGTAGGGGTTPSGPATGVIVTDSQGTTHEVRVSGSWADILQQAADSGWNGVTVPSGSVFSDETGVYAVGWNGSLSGITGKTLAQVYNEGGSSLIKIDDSTKIWTSADISEGRWTGTPTSGDLIYINGQYKIVPAGASIGEWDVSAGAAVTLVQP